MEIREETCSHEGRNNGENFMALFINCFAKYEVGVVINGKG